MRPVLLLRDRPAFPFYRTSTVEAARAQWPLNEPLLDSYGHLPLTYPRPSKAKMAALVEQQKKFVNMFCDFVYVRMPPPPPSPVELALEQFLAERLERVEWNRSIRALEMILDDLERLAYMRRRRLSRDMFIFSAGLVPMFSADRAKIEARINVLLPPEYLEPVLIPDQVLGYEMPHYRDRFGISHDLWLEARTEVLRDDPLSPEELMVWLEDHCTQHWDHQRPDGTYVYHEDGTQPNLREVNLRALCVLPYPSRLITWVVEMTQRRPTYDVVHTVLCCEWVMRKMEQMKDIPPASYMFSEEGDEGAP
jgi:hypothetical protein